MINSSAWIRRLHRSASAVSRLVCLPYADGVASYFYPVSQRLSPDVDVLAVQYPGRQARRAGPPIDDIYTSWPVTIAEALAWRAHTEGAFLIEVFSDGHFFLNDHTDEVPAFIRERLTG